MEVDSTNKSRLHLASHHIQHGEKNNNIKTTRSRYSPRESSAPAGPSAVRADGAASLLLLLMTLETEAPGSDLLTYAR